MQKKPFSIALKSEFVYMSAQHQEALAHLLYGTENDGCIVLLTGDVGTGKTTLCRCMMERLPEDTEFALILNPNLTITDLLKTICEEFGISLPPHPGSNKIYIDLLNTYLLSAHAAGKNSVLIIDEAQNLEMDVLEQLRLLTNLETDDQKLLKIVLLGQSELYDILGSPQLAQINQRITTRYHLRPLPADDVVNYIEHRIVQAGGPGISLFSKKAIHHIIAVSRGIPRIINLICNQALLGAYANSKDRVSAKIARKAAGEVLTGVSKPLPANRHGRILWLGHNKQMKIRLRQYNLSQCSLHIKKRSFFIAIVFLLTASMLLFWAMDKKNTLREFFLQKNSWLIYTQKHSEDEQNSPVKSSAARRK